MKLITGPTRATCNASASQPHSKTAVTAPKDAPTDSRKPRAAVSGTTNERKTMSSSTRLSPMTTTPKGTSASASRVETSICAAVRPATRTRTASVPPIEGASSRSRSTRSAVAGSLGAVVGIAMTTPVSAPRLGVESTTRSTPGTASTCARS